MKKPTWKLTAAALAASILLPLSSSRAEDSFPPCWRGQPSTTYQNWSFTNANNPVTPEQYTNPNGLPQAAITVGSFGQGWVSDSFGPRTGVWDIGQSGQISLTIPNTAGPWKYVQVQVTFFEQAQLNFVAPSISVPGGTLISSAVINNQSVFGGTWKTTNTVWLVQPSPTAETITISSDASHLAHIDQVVVDTRGSAGGDGDIVAFRPCWRGQAGSTFQQWLFGLQGNPSALVPEIVTNPYGASQGGIVPGTFSSGWINQNAFYGCRQGIWDLGRSGTLTLNIPNTPAGSSDSYKYVRVQVTQYRDASLYIANAAVSIAGGTLLSQQLQTLETTTFGAQWVTELTVWRLGPPTPASEAVVITAPAGGALIDQVAVDTFSVDFPCPSDMTVDADPGQCTKANVTWTLPQVNGCTITNVTSTPLSGSTLPVGTNAITVVIQGADGGTKTCVFKVIVRESVPPTVVCPADMTVNRDPAQCGAVVNFTATGSDNCSGAATVCAPPSGSLFAVGVTTVSCTARDASGNVSSPCTFTVTVRDLTGDVSGFRPCWRGQADSTFQQWVFGANVSAAIPPAQVSNAYGSPSANVGLGPYSSGWIDQISFYGCRQGLWDLGSNGTITLNIPNTLSASSGAYKYVRVQVTQYRDSFVYTNNSSASLAGGTLVSEQQQVIETTTFGAQWVVVQSILRVGPPSPASESVIITAPGNGSLIDQVAVDTLALDVPCQTNIVTSLDPGQCSRSDVSWTVPLPNGCTIISVVTKTTNGTVVTSPANFPGGVTPLIISVTDGEGYVSDCHFSVTVTDSEAPVARCKNVTLTLDATGQATLLPAQVDDGSTDNCAITERSLSKTDFNCSNLGNNSVTLTVEDAAGNEASCTATVTVVDAAPPVIALLGVSPVTVDCHGTYTDAGATANDNCGGNITAQIVTANPVNVNVPGTYTVTYNVSDAAGNPAVQVTRTVIVQDVEPPVPNVASLPDVIGECGGTVTLTPPTATDACAGTIIGTTTNALSNLPEGDYTVVWTYTDAASNSVSQTQIVKVHDTVKPVIALLGVSPVTVECHGTHADAGATASDNCGGNLTSQIVTVNPVNPNVVGTYTVTYNVSDGSGNA
ncbi:MAG: DUF5011 domain-containing protein, partial [Verrucomicrobia bacterium]|nr:DUF5011 domain-containing protein [Verrucomicrobiota bacterium]